MDNETLYRELMIELSQTPLSVITQKMLDLTVQNETLKESNKMLTIQINKIRNVLDASVANVPVKKKRGRPFKTTNVEKTDEIFETIWSTPSEPQINNESDK